MFSSMFEVTVVLINEKEMRKMGSINFILENRFHKVSNTNPTNFTRI